MAIAAIQHWLSDPNRTYHHGRLLYDQYGNNVVTKAIINTGHQGSAYHFAMLENALQELANTSPEEKIAFIPPLETFQKPSQTGISNEEYAGLPDELKSVRGDARKCFQRAQFLFARIPLTDSQDQRLQMALQLLDDFDENRRLMGDVQHFLDNGTVKEKPEPIQKLKPVEDLTIRELIAESKNLPPNITKAKKKLKIEFSQEVEDLMNARIERLDHIKRRLNE